MTDKVRRFNAIRRELGLPPDQPTTLLWMYCAETEEEAEEGWTYFHNQLLAAQHHYFEWNNPGYEGYQGLRGVPGAPDCGRGHGGCQLRPPGRATQPIGTPDEIIRENQEFAVDHQPGKSGDPHVLRRHAQGQRLEKSLRLFAEKVLPEVQAMPTTPSQPRFPWLVGQGNAQGVAPAWRPPLV